MKTGIIGLPQVGKTSLFTILTRSNVAQRSTNPREAHIGVATVPDDRWFTPRWSSPTSAPSGRRL